MGIATDSYFGGGIHVLSVGVIEFVSELCFRLFDEAARASVEIGMRALPTILGSRLVRVITREHLEVAVLPAGDCQLRIAVGVFCLGVIIPIAVDPFGPIDKNISCDALRSHDSG